MASEKMQQAILDFPKQLSFVPKIEHEDKLAEKDWTIVIGMGGSQLATDLVKAYNPNLAIISHRDYGLPGVPENVLANALVIASSYSGNTEEVLDGYAVARAKKLPIAVITVGGKLLEQAKEDGVPYIQIPDTGIQPRMATGYSVVALLTLLRQTAALQELNPLLSLDPMDLQNDGKTLAEALHGHVPVIYASRRNSALCYNWKIKMNETGKIPAFSNVVPELNHNEMNGFDVQEETTKLSANMHCIFLRDDEDDPRIQKRFAILKALYEERGLPVEEYQLAGVSRWERILRCLLVGDWCALLTATEYSVEAEKVPLVETFKNRMAA